MIVTSEVIVTSKVIAASEVSVTSRGECHLCAANSIASQTAAPARTAKTEALRLRRLRQGTGSPTP